jgi:hypothetical protein
MSPADTLALSADRLSQLLRDTIRERVLAAQAGEQMRSDVLGLDVQAICDVIAYEADVVAGVRFKVWDGDYLLEQVSGCTCGGGSGFYAHESGCGSVVVLGFAQLDRLLCPGCDICRPSQAVAA